MGSHSWTDVWKLFLDLLSRENIAMQIAIGLGAAFLAVMALEGIRASFFPKRIVESAALRSVAPSAASAAAPSASSPPKDDMRAAWNLPQEPVAYMPLPRNTVNADQARRSTPQPLRVIGARKPT
jgi:hypothetical protein